MRLYLSRFVHLVPVGEDRVVLLDALADGRWVLTAASAEIAGAFAGGADAADAAPELARRLGLSADEILGALAGLVERGILTFSPPEQQDEVARERLDGYARDPLAAAAGTPREALRRDYWAVRSASAPGDLAPKPGREVRILLVGDCDVEMEADFLEREGARRGVRLRALTVDPIAVGTAAAEMPHEAIILGNLSMRDTVAMGRPEDHGGDPGALVLAEARRLLTDLRGRSDAPIILNGLPVPTLQPRGRADAGRFSHRNRYRAVNLALADLAAEMADVYFADLDSALAAAGETALLDDRHVSFTHFGSSGWLLQRPESELAAVHHRMAPLDPLARRLGGEAYGRERAAAREHMDVLQVALGLDPLRCVVVDLDGTLWPGVLAETGAPFAWHPEVSSPYSYVGVYFGIHEALKALKERGVLLACASRNDEPVIRRLWRYAPQDPAPRLLQQADFAALRIGWQSKAESVAAIAAELGLPLGAVAFVDDSPHERADVEAVHPAVTVFGGELVELREWLLTEPRLMPRTITREAERRSAAPPLTRLHAEARAGARDEATFRASLAMRSEIRAARGEAEAARISELFERTTQFNLTGRRFGIPELLRRMEDGEVIALSYADRFGDQGLVGSAVVASGEIINLCVSCRVALLNLDAQLLDWIVSAGPWRERELSGLFIPTDRNLPVRNLYRGAGFQPDGRGRWRLKRRSPT